VAARGVNGRRVRGFGTGLLWTAMGFGLHVSAEQTASVLGNRPVPTNPYLVGFGDLMIMATGYICTA
jgi:hypothetical protein